MTEKYQIELWSKDDTPLLDISRYVTSFSYNRQRNSAEDLTLSIDLQAFEDICASISVHPTSVLSPYQTDIKIKRNGEYLFGVHVADVTTEVGEDSGTITVKAFGYLNLLIDRYVTATYIQQDAAYIAWDLIDTTQSLTFGDMGITLGSQQATTVNRDREYTRQNVKDAIINLTKLVDGNFDFEFTWDKKFNTYPMIGTDKSSSLSFIYPGNITSITIPRNATALFNKIYGIGSGFGADQIASTQLDLESRLLYGVHERISIHNSVTSLETLQQNVAAELARRKSILEIPQMTVSGEDVDLNTLSIGDRVYVRVDEHPFLATVDGVYRIERYEVSVDREEAETIKLYFDNHDLNQADYDTD